MPASKSNGLNNINSFRREFPSCKQSFISSRNHESLLLSKSGTLHRRPAKPRLHRISLPRSTAYLSHWIELLKKEPKILFQVMRDANAASKLIWPEELQAPVGQIPMERPKLFVGM